MKEDEINKPTVVIVEDFEGAIIRLKKSLPSFDIVGIARNGDEFWELFNSELVIDLAILGMRIPSDGEPNSEPFLSFKQLTSLTSKRPKMRILFFSAATPFYGLVQELMDLKVGGYILKSEDTSDGRLDLIAQGVLQGGMYFSSAED